MITLKSLAAAELRRISIIFQTTRELGMRPMLAYAQYKLLLHSGWLQHASAQAIATAQIAAPALPLPLPCPAPQALRQILGEIHTQELLAEADEICAGQVRLFGADLSPLRFDHPGPLLPWTHYEGRTWLEERGDIKFIWEAGRFAWAILLARAYAISNEPRFANAFWQHSQAFFTSNPPGLGVQWASAQEVALRLIALACAWQVFAAAPESTPERAARLARWLAACAGRIPASLSYAQAQANNHLLSEAAGLYTAGIVLPTHPQASRWRRLGWQRFCTGLEQQTSDGGEYTQHSANYHRLMLHLALWINHLAALNDQQLPEPVRHKLHAALHWLEALVDPLSGRVANLGHNDGACILPLAQGDFFDYRPVLQAARLAFCGQAVFEPGPWDEMALWLPEKHSPSACPASSQPVLRPTQKDWAFLRTVQSRGRPGHADLLHVDIWRNGNNLALDAGTYLYNTPAPWDNSLMVAQVHNTITINGLDQMRRAGRFLYLDKASARLVQHQAHALLGETDSYRKLGIHHQRSLAWEEARWVVTDYLSGSPQSLHARLHWLLADYPWQLIQVEQGWKMVLQMIDADVEILITAPPGAQATLARSGERIAGSGVVHPTWGWFSPSYGLKVPALSLAVEAIGELPMQFSTTFSFEGNVNAHFVNSPGLRRAG